MLSISGHGKRQNWWFLKEFTACSKCSLPQLSNYEWTMGRDMIGCPVCSPGSNAKGSEEPSMLVG